MTTFTDKELIKEIRERIGSLDVRDNIERRAYEIALASLEAEPVGEFYEYKPGDWYQRSVGDKAPKWVPLYATPPVRELQADVAQAIENLKQKLVECNRYNYCADAVKGVEDACHAAMLQGIQPVSQTYNLPELIEGMEVSIDVSTCDADLGNRYFGTVTEALELDTAKNGYILLVQDAEPNFDVNGNYPVTPDGWVVVPKRLTAENGAKGALSGEFSETTFISCPECFGDDDCDTCDGSGRIEIKVPVTWTTIKSIWDKGIAYFAAEPPQEVNRG
ncbi:hypothetical protein LMJ97_00280 [Escherichia coli]|nr:hypothetical protein [Escherichia coli]MCG4430779.1 hypothetical protein [Escherichia coli]